MGRGGSGFAGSPSWTLGRMAGFVAEGKIKVSGSYTLRAFTDQKNWNRQDAKCAEDSPNEHLKICIPISIARFPIRPTLRSWRLGGESLFIPEDARIFPQYGNRSQLHPPHRPRQSRLLALRLFARIHQHLGHSLPLATLLESPTLRTLASRIDQSPNS